MTVWMRAAALLFAALAVAPLAAPAAAEPPTADPPPTRVIVRYVPGTDAGERAAARRAADVRQDERLPLARTELVEPGRGRSATQAAARLERSDAVAYAEPDVARRAFVVPDDDFFGAQWGLDNRGQTVDGRVGTADADIDAPEAWDTTTGLRSVTVAVVDSGVDTAHPDLAPNIWRNPAETGETARAGVDDDGNGLVDDVAGWDFVEGDATPQDADGHGTHVAGTIGARGADSTGVAGTAWNVALQPLRALGPDGSGTVSDVLRAYAYADAAGADVLNASLGGDASSRAERDAIAAADDLLFVVAAGNEGADNDVTPSFPCNYDLANVVCVAASDSNDRLASFSNTGATTVDLAAPGVAIASTWPADRWALLDGTSMATPHVAGAAALVLSVAPDLTPVGVRRALLAGADPVPGMAGRTATGARLNAAGALDAVDGVLRDREAEAPAPAPTEAAPAVADPAPAGPAPAPQDGIAASTPLAPPDRSAPMVTLSRPSRDLAALVRRGLRTRVHCSEECRLRLRLTVSRATARRLGLRGTTLASARARRTAAGGLTVTPRLTPAARRALRRTRRLRAVLALRATDDAGNAATRRFALRLRRR